MVEREGLEPSASARGPRVMTLTVRGEEEDLVRALRLGADDLARVEALLRWVGMESTHRLPPGGSASTSRSTPCASARASRCA
jgi:hypothetical protein